MKVVILQDCSHGKAGERVTIACPNTARAMVRAGVARWATMRDAVLAPKVVRPATKGRSDV